MTKRKKVSHKKKKWRDVLRPCQVGNVFRTDKWLSGDAVMRKLCVSRRTLQNYRDNRILPYSVVGGKFYYSVRDIEDLMKDNYVSANL